MTAGDYPEKGLLQRVVTIEESLQRKLIKAIEGWVKARRRLHSGD